MRRNPLPCGRFQPPAGVLAMQLPPFEPAPDLVVELGVVVDVEMERNRVPPLAIDPEVGNRPDEASARFQHPAEFAEQRLGIRHVLQGLEADHQIHRRIAQPGEPGGIPRPEIQRGATRPVLDPGVPHGPVAQVHPVHPANARPGGEDRGSVPEAAGRIQDHHARLHLAAREHVAGQVGVRTDARLPEHVHVQVALPGEQFGRMRGERGVGNAREQQGRRPRFLVQGFEGHEQLTEGMPTEPSRDEARFPPGTVPFRPKIHRHRHRGAEHPAAALHPANHLGLGQRRPSVQPQPRLLRACRGQEIARDSRAPGHAAGQPIQPEETRAVLDRHRVDLKQGHQPGHQFQGFRCQGHPRRPPVSGVRCVSNAGGLPGGPREKRGFDGGARGGKHHQPHQAQPMPSPPTSLSPRRRGKFRPPSGEAIWRDGKILPASPIPRARNEGGAPQGLTQACHDGSARRPPGGRRAPREAQGGPDEAERQAPCATPFGPELIRTPEERRAWAPLRARKQSREGVESPPRPAYCGRIRRLAALVTSESGRRASTASSLDPSRARQRA
jgi:hypothetical protein